MSERTPNEPKRPLWLRYLFPVLCCLVFLIWFGFLTLQLLPSESLGRSSEWRGQLGDSFGVINALFTGLALAGVVTALLFQKEDLKLTRQDLQHTREEMKEQSEQLKKQAAIAALQSFVQAAELTARPRNVPTEIETVIAGQTVLKAMRREDGQQRARLDRGEALTQIQFRIAKNLPQLLAEAFPDDDETGAENSTRP